MHLFRTLKAAKNVAAVSFSVKPRPTTSLLHNRLRPGRVKALTNSAAAPNPPFSIHTGLAASLPCEALKKRNFATDSKQSSQNKSVENKLEEKKLESKQPDQKMTFVVDSLEKGREHLTVFWKNKEGQRKFFDEAKKHLKDDTAKALGSAPRYIFGVLIAGAIGLYIDTCFDERKTNLAWLRKEEQKLGTQISRILSPLETEVFRSFYAMGRNNRVSHDDKKSDDVAKKDLSLNRIGAENAYLKSQIEALEKEIENSFWVERRIKKPVSNQASRIKKTLELQEDLNHTLKQCAAGIALSIYGFYEQAEPLLVNALPNFTALQKIGILRKGEHFGILHALGIVEMHIGKRENAHVHFDEIINGKPNAGYTLAAKGELLCMEEKFTEALLYFSRALQCYEKSIFYLGYANALHGLKREQEALDAYNKACDLAPKDWDIRSRRAWFLCDSKNDMASLKKALSDIDTVVLESPANAIYHSTRAHILKKLCRKEEAYKAMNTAINIAGDANHSDLKKYRATLLEWETGVPQQNIGTENQPPSATPVQRHTL